MKKQLNELDERLFDSQARLTGTAAVVLHGPPGSGKTHLARQYLYKHRSRFKGGIFWINARIPDEMRRDLWQIAQKFVARDSPQIRIDPSGNGRNYITAVREWFSSRSEWLIIVDGVALDNRVQAEEIQAMIPDSTNSSLIYTSRSSQLYASQRLLHPHPIRLPKLTEKEGQELMFRELNIKKTRSNEKAAIELVKKVGGLPLAIHAMSVRLAETHEPLEKYSPKSYADDPRLGVPYHEILDNLWSQHTEAYNLVNILAFFGPHIPVELVSLGVRGLRTESDQVVEVRSKASEYEAADINTSFGILMRNALLERNETDDTDSAASSRSSLLEPEPIDVLRLHTVVQKFCRDRLNKGRQLTIWLDLAWKACLRSYQGAKLRMDERAKEGDVPRVSDFREYLIHAQRMRDLTMEYEQRNAGLRELRPSIEELISEIKNEIAQREPGSSQESVIRHYAVSIFDRTSSTSSTDSAPITPGFRQVPQALQLDSQSPWGTELTQTPTFSPTDYQVGAEAMLRRFSGNTVRPDETVVEEAEVVKEPRHTRAGSRPAFDRGNFKIPASVGLQAQVYGDHARGELSSSPMSRLASGSSKAASDLAEIYRNSPPMSTLRLTPPAQEAFQPPTAENTADRPSLARGITRRSAAGTQLTPRSLDPTAAEFTPSSWPGYTSFVPTVTPTNWTNYSAVDQNGFLVNNPGAVVADDPILFQGQLPSRQIRSSIGNASIDANIHASSQNGYIDPTFYQTHHGRASSVPELPIHQISGFWSNEQLMQSGVNLAGPLSPPLVNMSRDNSSHSRSSSSATTALRPPSNPPQFISPWALPAQHPLAYAQSSNPSPLPSSQTGLIRGSSPLQQVQTPGQTHSAGSMSPAVLGQVAQHPSPPLPQFGQNGSIIYLPGTASGAQSAPATTVFPPPASPNNIVQYCPQPHPQSTVQLSQTAQVHGSPAISQEMSRSSSNPGPGIVVAAPGYGLGIAEFGTPAAIRFGQQEPVNILEAQRRAEIQQRFIDEERQRRIEAQRRAAAYRGLAGQPFGIQSEILPSVTAGVWGVPPSMVRSIPQLSTASSDPAAVTPYPQVNLIPTDSDKHMLQSMVDERASPPQTLGQQVPQQQAYQQQQQHQQQQSPFPPPVSRGRGLSDPAKKV